VKPSTYIAGAGAGIGVGAGGDGCWPYSAKPKIISPSCGPTCSAGRTCGATGYGAAAAGAGTAADTAPGGCSHGYDGAGGGAAAKSPLKSGSNMLLWYIDVSAGPPAPLLYVSADVLASSRVDSVTPETVVA
jgi:hypothetical protein